MIAESVGEFPEIIELTGGETESRSETGNGMTPSFRKCANPHQDGSETGIDGSAFIRSDDASRLIDQMEIVSRRERKYPASMVIGLNRAEPGIGRSCRDTGAGGKG